MTPTEKHRETAREVVMGWATSDGLVGLEDRVATALAKAEREGMEAERARCADLLAAVTGVFRRCEIENDWTALIETLSTAILSEAGKAE